MRVRFLTDQAGPGSLYRGGEEYDLPKKEALAVIKADQAERVVAEKATAPPVAERATNDPTNPPRRGRRNK